MAGLTDTLHLRGISVIQTLQLTFEKNSGFMVLLSHFGDPRFAFTIYFPVAYFLHKSVGIRVLWVAVIAEWLNAVAKWLLHGERPYWWIHESGLYSKSNMPKLEQYNITCETGPGSPSGHAMITSAVWYILLSDFLYYQQVTNWVTRVMCWMCYLSVMFAVCVSRLFIATHFPHQVVAGILVGILLAKILNSLSTSAIKLHHYVSVSISLAACATAVYLLVSGLGYDPLWSVVVAKKWCAYKEWVHLDTTLFYSIVRDISSLLGLGIGVWMRQVEEKPTQSTAKKFLQIALAMAVTMSTDKLKPAHDNLILFYALGFIKHLVVVCFVVAGVPGIFNMVWH